MKISLIISEDDTVNILLFDDNRRLRRKIWVYPDGTTTYRDWKDNKQISGSELGEKVLLEKIK